MIFYKENGKNDDTCMVVVENLMMKINYITCCFLKMWVVANSTLWKK